MQNLGQNKNMPYMIINADHPSILKKICCFRARFAILLIQLGDFNKYIKCNPLV